MPEDCTFLMKIYIANIETTVYAIFIYIASIVTTLLAYHAWKRRKTERGMGDFATALALIALWTCCSALWLLHLQPVVKLYLQKLAYVSITMIPVVWVRFALTFAHQQPQKQLHRRRILLIIPVLTLIMIWTNPMHHWFWRDENSIANTVWWAIEPAVYGPWFWIHTAYSYLLIGLGAIPVLQIANRSAHRYRLQALLLLLTIVSLSSGSVLVVLPGSPLQQRDPSGFLIAFSGFLGVWGIFRYRVLEQLALSQNLRIEGSREGVVVLDADHNIADVNQIAHLLLHIPFKHTIIGERAEHIFTPWTVWAPFVLSTDEQRTELALDYNHHTQWLEVHSRPLQHFRGRQRQTGTLLTLQDISDRKWTEQVLEARRHELAELNTLSRAIAASLSLHEVLQSTVNAVMRLFPQASDATVQLMNAQKTRLYTHICATRQFESHPKLEFKIGEGLAGVAAQTQTTLNVPDVLEDRRYVHIKGTTTYRSMLVTPLLFGAQVLGTLSVVAPSPQAFNQNEAALLEDLARFAAIAVQNAHLYEQAQTEIAERKQVVAALRQNELRYRALFDNTNDAIFIIGLDGTYLTANQQASAMLGYTREELLTHHPEDIIVPEEHDDARNRLTQLTDGTRIPIYERRFRCKDGRVLVTEISIALIHDPEGHPLHIQSVVRDITQRKAAEEALRQSEEKHRLLLDSIQSPVLALDHAMQILYCNTAYGNLVSMTPEALTGQNLKTLFPGFSRSRTYEMYQRCLETRQLQAIEGWAEAHYFKAHIYPTPWGLLAIADDATEQRQAQDTLQQYTDRLQVLHEIDRAILETQSPKAIALTTLHQIRRLIPCQRSLILEFDATGKSQLLTVYDENPERILPSAWEEPLHSAEIAQHQHIVSIENLETLTARSPLQEQLFNAGIRAYLWAPLAVLERPIGLLCLESEYAHAFQEDHAQIAGEIAVSLAIAIHQARLNEQTQQDAAIKTTLIDKINHRVKNNLASIIGLIFMTQRYLEPVAQKTCAPMLDRLANQIHTLSTVHQMFSNAEWQLLPLSGFAEQVVQTSLQAIAPQARIGLNVAASPIKIDSRQADSLALILHELVINTTMHGLNQRAAAQISILIETEAPGPWGVPHGIRLEFQDDGPGYPETVLTQRQQRMGLYLIQRLVAINLRGTMTLANANGASTVLRFAMCPQDISAPQE